jgi:2-dehydro-3-deoxygalactonokinase
MKTLIAIDWGTSRLRALLLNARDDSIVARREGPGIGALRQSPIDTLRETLEPWLATGEPGRIEPARIVMCGMAGSRNGVVEVPYGATPATVGAWLQAAKAHHAAGLDMIVGAGLRATNLLGVQDVMRGEETQIFGAMRLHASLSEGRQLFVLPGTHSKWVEVQDGAILRFHTVFTGELFALLRDHSTLLKAGPADIDAAGFDAGVARSGTAGLGIQAMLFEARSAQLVAGRSGKWALEFLSGLLIGSEVAQMREAFGVTSHVTLVGDPELRARYREVFAVHEVRTHELDGEDCVLQGLRVLARSA